MNTSEIVKSVNLIMAIEWGELQALDELNIQFSLQETYILVAHILRVTGDTGMTVVNAASSQQHIVKERIILSC